ncbi:MAG: DUF2071 domain-containing protein [Acidobacteriaceae bacterium]|nr:DUF2071 domain-containing protein [Acidobacteriaceae bacterium]
MSTFLTAEWRKLIMAQYEVAPESLLPYLPAGVELDLFQGRCYVSLVGFLFDRVRLKGLPIPGHTCFEEINLRFYVRRPNAPDGQPRRGVVFLREFVPRAAVTWLARAVYGEPYSTMPTQHEIRSNEHTLFVEYGWQHHGVWQSVGVEAELTAQPLAPGSLEEFITEHYWGYTRRKDDSTWEYAVHHPRWETYAIKRFDITASFGELCGTLMAGVNPKLPAHVLLAEGSEISVYGHAPEPLK